MRTKLEKLFAYQEDRIIDAIDIINQNLLKTVFIINKNKILIGIVSDGDIRRAILKNIPLTDPVKKIMNKNPLVAKIGIPEDEVLNILLKKNIQIIPILDNKRRVVEYYHITDFIKEKYLKKSVREVVDLKEAKKILVTGGAGYIGSQLVRILLESGYSVRVLDKLTFGKESVEELLQNPNFELIEGDYTKIEDLIPCLRNVYSVIHLAAIVGDPASKVDPELTEEINFYGVKILAEFCKYYEIDRLIFISTCSVYGASNNELLTEHSPLNPISLYAKTKLKAEKALIELSCEELDICILRLGTVFGWSNRMRFDLVVNLLTALSIKNKKISIFSSKQWRPFIHVKDVGYAILNVLNHSPENISGQIFNIGKDENNFQIEEIGKIMKNIFSDIKVIQVEDKEDNRSYRVSFKKVNEKLGFVPKYSLEDGIREIADILKKENINFKDMKYSNYKQFQHGIFESIAFFE